MTLIKCIECNKEISSDAIACPNCGYQMKKNPSFLRTFGMFILLLITGILIFLYSVKDIIREIIYENNQKKQIRYEADWKLSEDSEYLDIGRHFK